MITEAPIQSETNDRAAHARSGRILDRMEDIGFPILVATHPRSGTHLTIDTCRRQFAECDIWKLPAQRMDRLYLPLEAAVDRVRPHSERSSCRVLLGCPRPLLKAHCLPTFFADRAGDADWLLPLRNKTTVLYVHRDGRDVLCSLKQWLSGFSEQARVPMSEFLRSGSPLNRVQYWAQHVRQWLSEPNVTVIPYESLVRQPRQTILNIGQVVALTPRFREPLLPRNPRTVLHSRWMRLTSTRPESTAIIGGKSPDWRRVFSRADREFFHEHAGDVLKQLGYITTDDWVDGRD